MRSFWRFLRELVSEPPPPRPTGHRPNHGRRHHGHGEHEELERLREADEQVMDAGDDAGPPSQSPHH